MSTLAVDTITDVNGGNNARLNGPACPDNSMGFRNRIINGDMRIDQRNAGASVTPTNGQYTLDRWQAILSVASKFSVQQNAGAVTTPAGFINYLGATSLSAYSVGATETFALAQNIEGLNVSDLDWGTANAKTVTLSFWVRSSLTGTFGGSLKNYDSTRSYPFSYSISVADTWEYKTIVVAGDISGTWLTTNGIGVAVLFGLGNGSTRSGPAGAWAAINYTNATGATSVVGTSGATFYITGVQLEVGSVGTPFERRDYGRELALVQRYYQESGSISGYFYNATGGGRGVLVGSVPMRAGPTLSTKTGSLNIYYSNTASSGTFTFNASGGGLAFGASTFFGAQTPVATSTTGQGWAGDNNAGARRVTMDAEL